MYKQQLAMTISVALCWLAAGGNLFIQS